MPPRSLKSPVQLGYLSFIRALISSSIVSSIKCRYARRHSWGVIPSFSSYPVSVKLKSTFCSSLMILSMSASESSGRGTFSPQRSLTFCPSEVRLGLGLVGSSPPAFSRNSMHSLLRPMHLVNRFSSSGDNSSLYRCSSVNGGKSDEYQQQISSMDEVSKTVTSRTAACT